MCIRDRRQTGLLARSVCMGVMATFALQTALYVLQNFGFMLLSAYGLPLLSYGANYLLQTCLLYTSCAPSWREM